MWPEIAYFGTTGVRTLTVGAVTVVHRPPYGTIGTKGYREELVYYSKGGVSEGTPIVLNVADNKENAPFKIYPNPITDYLVIDNSGAADEGISATLYNVAGAAVRSCKVAPKGTVVLDTSVLPGGFYVLSVKASGGTLRNYKVVKH